MPSLETRTIVEAVQVTRVPAFRFECGDVLRCEVCGGFARNLLRRAVEMPVFQTLDDGTTRIVCLRCQTIRA